MRVERWQARLEGRFSNAEPNAAHLAVTRLQRAGLAPVVVTQNIDGLHQKAGTVNVIELHGTSAEAVCLDCARRMPIDVALDRVREGDEDPHCELCGGLLKTATISFGQPLVPADMDRALEEARQCDVCLAVGSTLSVWPAASVPVEAVRHGGRLVIINEGATDLDGMASLLLAGRAGTVMDELAAALLGARTQGRIRSPRQRGAGPAERQKEVIPTVSEVKVREGETFESALRRFNKKIKQNGILSEVRRREHYEKPSVRRKRKLLAARKRRVKST